MSRRPARATQADMRRAIEAAQAAGPNFGADILPDGTIKITELDLAKVYQPPRLAIVAPPAIDQPEVRGFVYFIHAPEINRVKIGFSTNLKERISALSMASPTELILMGSVHGTYADEAALHRRFSALRHHREWFNGAATLISYIETVLAGSRK